MFDVIRSCRLPEMLNSLTSTVPWNFFDDDASMDEHAFARPYCGTPFSSRRGDSFVHVPIPRGTS